MDFWGFMGCFVLISTNLINLLESNQWALPILFLQEPVFTFLTFSGFLYFFVRFSTIFFEKLFWHLLPLVFPRPKQCKTPRKYLSYTPKHSAKINRSFKKLVLFLVERGRIQNKARTWKHGFKRPVEPRKTGTSAKILWRELRILGGARQRSAPTEWCVAASFGAWRRRGPSLPRVHNLPEEPTKTNFSHNPTGSLNHMSVDNEVGDGRGRGGRGADEQQSALHGGRMEEEDALSCWKEGEEVEEEGGEGEGGVEEAREKKEEDACIRHFLKMHGPTVASWQDAKDFWHQAKNAAESEAHDLAAREAAIRCLTRLGFWV